VHQIMEIKPEFGVEKRSKSMDPKKKMKFELIDNNLSSLRELGRKLKAIHRGAFRRKYENLLGLLELEVQIPAIMALAHYYDTSLRCFTFQDFQLVPTVEEYEQILDMPLNDGVPYRHFEQHVSIPTLSPKFLRMS